MREAISNTSPLVYLHRIGKLDWLAKMFGTVWIPGAVALELEQGRGRGYDVPDPIHYAWIRLAEPRSMPSEWLALDLGPGELAAMALALENRDRVVLLDDSLARRVALAAGLEVRGTLGIVLAAKAQGMTDRIEPIVDTLTESGMWVSPDIRQRILKLAQEV